MDYLDTRPWTSRPTAFPRHYARWLRTRLTELGIPPRRVDLVEWGVGSGDFMRELEAAGFRTRGFDLLPRAGRTTYADFNRPVDGGDPAHVCTCRNVLEHLQDPTPLLQSIRATLLPEGLAVISVPDWGTYRDVFYSDYTHVRPYDRSSLAGLLTVNGFEVVRVYEMIQHPPCWDSRLLTLLANACREVVPLRWAQALADRTGWEFWRWACLRTVVIFCRRRA